MRASKVLYRLSTTLVRLGCGHRDTTRAGKIRSGAMGGMAKHAPYRGRNGPREPLRGVVWNPPWLEPWGSSNRLCSVVGTECRGMVVVDSFQGYLEMSPEPTWLLVR